MVVWETSKSVEEIYRKLSNIVDQLEPQQGVQISLGEALLQLIESMKLQPSDFSWSWRINETQPTDTAPDKDNAPGTQLTNRHE